MWRLLVPGLCVIACGGASDSPVDAPLSDAAELDAPVPDASPDATDEPGTLIVDPPVAFDEQLAGRKRGDQLGVAMSQRGSHVALVFSDQPSSDVPATYYLATLDAEGEVVGAPMSLAPYRVMSNLACLADGVCGLVGSDEVNRSYFLRISATAIDATEIPAYSIEYVSEPRVGSHADGFVVTLTGRAHRFASTGPRIGGEIDLIAALGSLPSGVRFVVPGCQATGCWVADDGGELLFVNADGTTLTSATPPGLGIVSRVQCSSAACFAFGLFGVSRKVEGQPFEPAVGFATEVTDASASGTDVIAWIRDFNYRPAAVRLPAAGPLTSSVVSITPFEPFYAGARAGCIGARCIAVVGSTDGIDSDIMRIRLDGTTVLDTMPVLLSTGVNAQDQPSVACSATACLVTWRDRRVDSVSGQAAVYVPGSGWLSSTSVPLPFVPERTTWTGTRFVVFDATDGTIVAGLRAVGLSTSGEILDQAPLDWLPSDVAHHDWDVACVDRCALVWRQPDGIWLRWFTTEGAPLDSPTRIATGTEYWLSNPHVGWMGDRWVMAWSENLGNGTSAIRGMTLHGAVTSAVATLATGNYAPFGLTIASQRGVIALTGMNGRGAHSFGVDLESAAGSSIVDARNVSRINACTIGGHTVLQWDGQAAYVTASGAFVGEPFDLPPGDLAGNGDEATQVAAELDDVFDASRLSLRTMRVAP